MTADGQKIIHTVQKGEYFGEVALLTKFKRNSTVKATTFCLLKEISRSELEGVLASFP